MDFSLASVRNISIEWDYKWIDYPEFLIYRPKLLVDSFSIIPIHDYNNQKYRDNERSLYVPQEIDLNQYDINYENRPVDDSRYDLGNQRYNLYNNYQHNVHNLANHQSNKHANHRPHVLNTDNQYNRPNSGAYQFGHYHRERIHKFCPLVHNDGIEARNETVLVRCH